MHKKIKKIYKTSAAIILGLSVLISGFFVYKGYTLKKNNVQPSSSVTTPAANDVQSNSDKTANTSIDISSSYILSIQKIGLTAPIALDVDGNNKETYNKALENGVAHLKGSSHPGKTGNVFIFGHSSYDPNKAGNYKEIFSKLNELTPGDIIEIQSKDIYRYKINNKKVVPADDVTVAAQNYAIKQLTLMTCWPIGTNKERLVVVGELIEQ